MEVSSRNEAKALPWRKKALFALAAMGIGLVLATGAGEVLVRILAPQPPIPRWFKQDPEYGYVLKQNFHQRYSFPGSDFTMDVQTNGFGHRDEAWDASEPFAGLTVLLLGDSFVFGFGVNRDDRLDTRLEDLFQQAGIPARVINAGVPGWGTVQQAKYAREHFELFQPDIVVFTFCGNDPHDDRRFLSSAVVFEEGGLVRFPGKEWLRRHSQLYRYLLEQTAVWRHQLYLALRQQEAAEGGGTTEAKNESQPSNAHEHEPHADAQSGEILTAEDWDRTIGTIRGFRDDFLAYNASGLVLVQATAPTDEGIRRNLSEVTDGERLRYVDGSALASTLTPEERRLPYDGHWSPAMHALSARALFDEAIAGRLELLGFDPGS